MQFDHGMSFPIRRHTATLFTTTLLTLLACQTSFAGGVPKETFPKLSGYQIGATPFDGYLDPAYHKEMAKLDLVIIGSTKAIANETAAAVRRLNPNAILVKYTSLRSTSSTFAGYMQIKRDKADAEKGPNQTNASDWWARDFDGNHVSHWTNNWTVNITSYVKPDANGDRFPEWAAKLDFDWWIKYDQWDGVYEDSVHWVPRTAHSGAAIDWSGGTESDSDKIAGERERLENKIEELEQMPLDYFGSQKNKRTRIGYYRYRLEELDQDPKKYFSKPEKFEGNGKQVEKQ